MCLLSEATGSKEQADEIVNRLTDGAWGDKSIGKIDVWSHDARAYDRARIEMGDLIEEARP